MNATNYYVSTSRVVLQGDPEAAQTWQVRQPGNLIMRININVI